MKRTWAARVGFDNMHEKAPNGCWLWKGGLQVKGYGDLRFEGVRWLAHRLAWTRAKGPIPEGQQVLHKCDTPACVNPDHLFLGTNEDNHADKRAKGRQYRVFTESDVRWIHYLRHLGASYERIAAIIGKSSGAAVSLVCRGINWKTIKPFDYNGMEA